MKKALSAVLVIAGAGFILLATVYCMTPAHSLPSYLPGYDPGLDKVHYKHALGALILGVASFFYPWLPARRKPFTQSALRRMAR